MNENELMHYGVLGMKWGVRRYQNTDGSLTSAGQKKVSKQYDRLVKKVNKKVNKKDNAMRLKAYNKAADSMNRGGIDKFNAQQKKKYGDNFAERKGYMEAYSKTFQKEMAKHYDQSLNTFYSNNKNFKKAEQLVKKYDMTKWDDFARQNQAVIDDLRKNLR